MHVGLDGIPLTEPKTGIGHYTYELASALAHVAPKSIFELIYPSTHDPISLSNLDGQPSVPANLRVTRIRVGWVGRHWWSTGLPRHLRTSGVELFHGTNYDVPLWRQCPTVLTVHDLSLLIYPETHEKRRVNRFRRRLPFMTRGANALIVPTESVRREVCERLGLAQNKVFAVPEAARACFTPMEFEATAVVRQRFGIDDDFLLAVGTIEPRKNLTLLVAAFEEYALSRSNNSLQLVIAGNCGWLSGPLLDAVKKSRFVKRIILTEYLNDEELRALYSSCRAFVYPSIYEGFGLPPLEAMACGAPVITSRIPSILEVAGSAALFFDPNDKLELVKCIASLLEDESAAIHFSQAGERRAAEFSWQHTAEQTLAVYSEVLSRVERSGLS